jgi:uncharacterized repeat protein (TIGR03803 family)
MKKIEIGELATMAVLLLAVGAMSAHAQTYTDVYNFGTNPGDPINFQGPHFVAQGTDGNLYSTSGQGGADGSGTVFRMTPAGNLAVLLNVSPAVSNEVRGGLTLCSDGNFYGTSEDGGHSRCSGTGCGFVFKITPQGQPNRIYSFTGKTNPYYPIVPPIVGVDHNLYGTTLNDGIGSVYKLTLSGELTTLFGRGAPTVLILATDGNFYGIDATNPGSVFQIKSTGESRVFYTFDGRRHGGAPSSLIQGNDGSLYGTTTVGGDSACSFGGCGLVFRLTLGGGYAVLHYFNGADGWGPDTLLQASDGNLYGTTQLGGTGAGCPTGGDSCGTFFQITQAGTFSVLHDFEPNTGYQPTSLLQRTDGVLYGLTDFGGDGPLCDAGCGVFYSFDMQLPPFVRLLPAWGSPGQNIGILGQGFTAVTAVSFNDVPATFNVVSDTYLTATVPGFVGVGKVTVTTPSGVLTSNTDFYVR